MSAPVGTLRALYTADGAYPVHVVQENGLPNIALTVFANDLRRILSDGSVRGLRSSFLVAVLATPSASP